MLPEIKQAFKRYEGLKIEEKRIKAELEELKPVILPHISADSPVETDQGTFTIKSKMDYEYSQETQQQEASLKDRKTREVQDGTATAKSGTPYVEYREKKEKE